MNTKLIIAALVALGGTQLAMGWGQKGHDTIAAIAERHLTPATKAALDSLLDGKSIVYWANWMDNASHTPKYDYSKTWHYKNIDADQSYASAPKHSKGDVVSALNREVAILGSPRESDAEKVLAVKMIVHFMGDLHQPMHLGHASDLGGNTVKVKFFKNEANLHSVWDSSLPEAAHKWSYTEWSDQLHRLPEAEERAVMGGDFDSWAEETYGICRQVYEKTPKGTVVSYDYIADWTPVVEQQFLKGGLRLADVLNQIFDPGYVPISSIKK